MRMTKRVKDTRFPIIVFVTSLFMMFLVSGVHMGLFTIFGLFDLNPMIQSAILIIFWGAISLVFTLLTTYQTRKTYEKPLRDMAEATRKVAEGDFSVYVSPYHNLDDLDYLDVMILDFNKMVEDLGSIETLKTDFFSNVSHEIKTPLAVISNSAQLLKKDDHLSEEQEENVEMILNASRRLTSLITNILKLNRLEKQVILTRLQRYFEDCMEKLKVMEAEKTRRAAIVSMSIGVIGTAFMAGSVFAVTANPPMIGLCILLAVPGFFAGFFRTLFIKKL